MARSSMANPLFLPVALAGAGFLSLAVSPVGAAAQTGEPVTIEEALQICAGVKKERDRLDCFEGLAAAAREDGSSGETADATEGAERPSADAGEIDAGEAAAAPVDDAGDFVGDEIVPVEPPRSADSEQTIDEPKPTTPGIAADPDPEPRQRFVILPADEAEERLSEPKTPGQKRERYRAKVRKAWRNGEERLFVLLETGEVYKQTDSNRAITPDPGDEIELRPSMIGGWFVEIRDGYRSTRMSLINK